MSVFYDEASLVLVPSGYKASKVYAQKPLTTDGQLTFSRASTATRVNASGLIETVASNVPRLDYLGSTCPRLLLEPQRTNLATWSEDFTNADWNKLNTTVTGNSVAAPDGTTTADTMTDDTTNQAHVVYEIKAIRTVGTAFSVFMKKGTLDYGYIGTVQSTEFFAGATINLTNGTVTETALGTSTTATVTVNALANGWYRVILQTNVLDGGLAFGPSNGSALSGTYKENIYTGTGSGTIYAWGAQLEDAAYASSYIPTTTAAVTRLAEACSKTGISSLIGQTEGTIYAEIVRTQSTANDAFWINISDNSVNNWIFLGSEGTYGRFYVRASNTVAIDQVYALSVGTHKLAIAYKSGSIVGYVDGVQIFTSAATFTIGSLTGTSIGPPSAILATAVGTAGKVNQALLFKTRLTNAQLAEITQL